MEAWGEVYLAEDLTLKREVDLKVLPLELASNPTYFARFHREAESAAALHHSNICTIYEIGEADGHSYICMEYPEGATLRQHMAGKALGVEEVLDFRIQIADASKQREKKELFIAISNRATSSSRSKAFHSPSCE